MEYEGKEWGSLPEAVQYDLLRGSIARFEDGKHEGKCMLELSVKPYVVPAFVTIDYNRKKSVSIPDSAVIHAEPSEEM